MAAAWPLQNTHKPRSCATVTQVRFLCFSYCEGISLTEGCGARIVYPCLFMNTIYLLKVICNNTSICMVTYGLNMYIPTHTHTHTKKYTRTHTYTHIHTHTHTHTHTHARTHAHTHLWPTPSVAYMLSMCHMHACGLNQSCAQLSPYYSGDLLYHSDLQVYTLNQWHVMDIRICFS